MGFTVTLDEESQKNERSTIMLNDEVVSITLIKNPKEYSQKLLKWSGGDYLELVVGRSLNLPGRTKLWSTADPPLHEEDIPDEDHTQTICSNDGDSQQSDSLTASTTRKEIQSTTEGQQNETFQEPQSRGEEEQPYVQETVIYHVNPSHGPLQDTMVTAHWISYRNDTVENLGNKFQAFNRGWQLGTTNRGNYEMWYSRLQALKSSKVPITNIVVLGLGSFHSYLPHNYQTDTTWRAGSTVGQLAIVMKIREVFGENGTLLPAIVQDPNYSALDKAFLRSLDFTVVDDPDAFSLINAHSLVFHIRLFTMGHWWVSQGVRPAAVITERYDWEHIYRMLHEWSPAYVAPALGTMFAGYDVDGEFSEDVIHERGALNIFVRKDAKNEELAKE